MIPRIYVVLQYYRTSISKELEGEQGIPFRMSVDSDGGQHDFSGER